MFEKITIWSIASMTKFIKEYSFGLPVLFMQQAAEKIDVTKDRIEVLYDGPNFDRSGGKNERYAKVGVKVLVHTTITPTDIYYHHRIKAKAIECLSTRIKLIKMGAPNNINNDYDRSIIGYLRPVPTEVLTVTPISVEEPDASIVEQVFNIDIC